MEIRLDKNIQHLENDVFLTMEDIEKSGVPLYLEEELSTFEAIADKCLQEEMIYMPDFCLADNGKLEQIRYNKVTDR